MTETTIKEKAIDYFTTLDDTRAQIVLSYMEALDFSQKARRHTLTDLKGKIQFSEGYDHKAMRSVQ
mgnify:CR=1 FL=1